MHKQHFAFPLEASLHLAPSVVVRPAAGRRAYFHHLIAVAELVGVKSCGPFKGCTVGWGGKAALTARQSVVEVDVAQVLWRPFWQAHFVVVVDYPPTEKTGRYIRRQAGSESESEL